jgi:hypothetical protein
MMKYECRMMKCQKARRAGIFVAHEIKKPIQLRRSGICRPDGAGFGFGGRCYKDAAPTALTVTAFVFSMQQENQEQQN